METQKKTSRVKRLAQRFRDWMTTADRTPIDIRTADIGFWHPLWL